MFVSFRLKTLPNPGWKFPKQFKLGLGECLISKACHELLVKKKFCHSSHNKKPGQDKAVKYYESGHGMQILKLTKEDWPIVAILQSSFISFKTCMARPLL